MCFGRIFKIGPFDDGVDRACFLAQAAIDAFCHVDIVSGGPPASILAFFGFDGNGLCGADLQRD